MRNLPKYKVERYMTANPMTTARNCVSPADRFCSCQRALSLGSTSLTVTYRSVPAANACNIHNNYIKYIYFIFDNDILS